MNEEAVYRKALDGNIASYAVLQEQRGDTMKLVNIPDVETQTEIFSRNLVRAEIELQEIGLRAMRDQKSLSYNLIFQTGSDPSQVVNRTSSEQELGRVLSGQTKYQWQQKCYGCYVHM